MTRYTPFEEMDRMFEQLRTRAWGPAWSWDSRQFDGGMDGLPVSSVGTRETDVSAPVLGDGEGIRARLDLTERDGEYVLVADLPGFDTDEIDLALDGDHLTIAATDEVTGDEFARTRRVSERVRVPERVEDDGVSATYRNGVLEVRLPVADGDDSARKIEIRD